MQHWLVHFADDRILTIYGEIKSVNKVLSYTKYTITQLIDN